MEKTDLKQLALAVYNKQVPANYSINAQDMEGTLRDTFRALASDFNSYRRNKLEIFEIIQDIVDEVLPKRVESAVQMFAEVKTFAQGTKARFKKKLGAKNVKRFITKVGLGGVYERVRLDSEFVDVTPHAIGGAGYVEFEQYLDGTMDFAELTNLIIDGMETQIYSEIYDALVATFSGLPAANKHEAASFDSAEMSKIIATVRAYGNATIFCTPEFAATITPADKFIGDAEKADMRNQGYIGKFAGADVVVLPQSFEDETNATKIFNPEYAFVVPTGGAANEKIVKVALEGQTIVDENKNADGSMDFQAYKKFGLAVLSSNYFGAYHNTGL